MKSPLFKVSLHYSYKVWAYGDNCKKMSNQKAFINCAHNTMDSWREDAESLH